MPEQTPLPSLTIDLGYHSLTGLSIGRLGGYLQQLEDAQPGVRTRLANAEDALLVAQREVAALKATKERIRVNKLIVSKAIGKKGGDLVESKDEAADAGS